MKKNEIFTFTAPNGAEVTGIVIIVLPSYENFEGHFDEYIVYAQNRIAFYHYNKDLNEGNIGGILVDYCVIPEYDAMLESTTL